MKNCYYNADYDNAGGKQEACVWEVDREKCGKAQVIARCGTNGYDLALRIAQCLNALHPFTTEAIKSGAFRTAIQHLRT